MLQNMRKYTQGWVATTLGILLSLAFVMWGIENYLRGNSKKDYAAKVGGVEISNNDLNANYQRVLLKLKHQTGDNLALTPAMQQQLKNQVLQEMIMQTVLVRGATKAGLVIAPLQTVSMIKQMPQFQENGVFSKERFERITSTLNYTHDSFIADVTQTLLINQLASGIAATDFVLPNELNQAIALMEQKRDISYAVIARDKFRKNVPVTAMTQYYQAHLNEFAAPEKVQLEYVQLSLDDVKKRINVSQQEITDYLSGNNVSAKNDAKELQKAKAALTQQKAEQEFVNLSDKLTDLTYTNPNSLTEAANALGLTVQSTPYFTKEGRAEDPLTKSPKILTTVFAAEFIKNNTNSNLIELNPGKVVVVRLKNHQPAAPLPFSDVKHQIEDLLIKQEAIQQAKQKGQQLITAMQTVHDFTKVLTNAGYQIKESHQVARTQADLDKRIIELAFDIAPNSKNRIASASLANGDYAIVQVNNITDLPTNKITEQQRENFSRLIAQLYGKVQYELYIQNQLSKTKIKIPPVANTSS